MNPAYLLVILCPIGMALMMGMMWLMMRDMQKEHSRSSAQQELRERAGRNV